MFCRAAVSQQPLRQKSAGGPNERPADSTPNALGGPNERPGDTKPKSATDPNEPTADLKPKALGDRNRSPGDTKPKSAGGEKARPADSKPKVSKGKDNKKYVQQPASGNEPPRCGVLTLLNTMQTATVWRIAFAQALGLNSMRHGVGH